MLKSERCLVFGQLNSEDSENVRLRKIYLTWILPISTNKNPNDMESTYYTARVAVVSFT